MFRMKAHSLYFYILNYLVADIARIIKADVSSAGTAIIEHLLFDSRKVYAPATSLFFAIKGSRRNGHHFIGDLYKKGVRHFVVSEEINHSNYPEAIFLVVNDTLDALQQLAVYHRQQFDIPVIGITGSNGKTIIKEWLYQLLHPDHNIIRSPKSYNSQIGVPLSVWGMDAHHTLAIFEAGISLPGEMEKLEKIIQPGIGVLTNIGEAHSEGFSDQLQKLQEKIKLFAHSNIIIHNGDNKLISDAIRQTGKKSLSWGKGSHCDIRVTSLKKSSGSTTINLAFHNSSYDFMIPFTDEASIENAVTVYAVLLYIGTDPVIIKERIQQLQPVNMRLELKKGINHC
ncbi:MAG TPA: Mur ligase family protein, partial [Chitinophagaceae bacterium]